MTQDIAIVDYQKQFLRRILFWLILATGIFLIWYLLSSFDSFLDEENIYVPVSINAVEVANYELDAPGMVSPVNLSIINDVIQDAGISYSEISEVTPPLDMPSATMITQDAITSTPNLVRTATPLANATTVVNSPAANPTSIIPPILPTLAPIISTTIPPIIDTLLPNVPDVPPIVPTVVQAVPSHVQLPFP